MSSTHIPWHKHGTALGRGVLDVLVPGCSHYFVPLRQDAHSLELLIDLVVAAAAGEHGCGLTNAGPLGGRASRAWWFDLPTGSPIGSVLILGPEHADALVRSINAAAQARGVTTPLPIASIVARSNVVADIAAAKIRLHQAAALVGRPVELVVIDDPAAGSLIRNAFPDAAIIVISDYISREHITDDTAIFETDGSTLFCVKSRKGTWAREFDLARVMMREGEAFVIKPGGEAEFEQEWVKSNTVPLPAPPPKPVVAEREPDERFAVNMTNRSLSTDEVAAWTAQGYIIVSDGDRAIPAPMQTGSDKLRLIEIVPTDRDGREIAARKEMARLEQLADSRGVRDRIRLMISDQRLRAWMA